MRTIRSGRSFIQYLPINLMACELILFFLSICFLCFFNLLLSQQSKIAGIILRVFFRDFSFRLTVTTDSKSAMFRYCSNNNHKKVNSMSSVTILFYLLQNLVCKILRSIKLVYIFLKFYTYIFNQAVKNGNTHEIQKYTPKHVKSEIFRNWIHNGIISSTQIKHCCDILWQNFDVINL